jgi:hypothetical protein
VSRETFFAHDCVESWGLGLSTYDSVPVGADPREQHLFRSVWERMAEGQPVVNAMLPRAEKAAVSFRAPNEAILSETAISFKRIEVREGSRRSFVVAFRSAEDRARYVERLDLLRNA